MGDEFFLLYGGVTSFLNNFLTWVTNLFLLYGGVTSFLNNSLTWVTSFFYFMGEVKIFYNFLAGVTSLINKTVKRG